jgi:hypothetical protein
LTMTVIAWFCVLLARMRYVCPRALMGHPISMRSSRIELT